MHVDHFLVFFLSDEEELTYTNENDMLHSWLLYKKVYGFFLFFFII